MANYFVDASIIAAYLVKDALTENVDRLFDQLGDGIELYIPAICLVECTNVLWKRVRFQSMPEGEAEILLQDLRDLPFKVASIEDVLPRALNIGLAYQLAVYDSLYIALAEQYKFPLITADAKQEAVATTAGITIKPITDF